MKLVWVIHANLALFMPLMEPEYFAILTAVIGVLHSMGGVHFRKVTIQPLSEK
jgi:hypothetical protein